MSGTALVVTFGSLTVVVSFGSPHVPRWIALSSPVSGLRCMRLSTHQQTLFLVTNTRGESYVALSFIPGLTATRSVLVTRLSMAQYAWSPSASISLWVHSFFLALPFSSSLASPASTLLNSSNSSTVLVGMRPLMVAVSLSGSWVVASRVACVVMCGAMMGTVSAGTP